jgi:cytochrome d ubiquinol oxidase subunit II
VILSAVCGLGSLVLLRRHEPRGARLIAVAAVVSVIVGWGIAQSPYLLPTTLEVEDAAAPSGTLDAVLVVFLLAVVVRAQDERARGRSSTLGDAAAPSSCR